MLFVCLILISFFHAHTIPFQTPIFLDLFYPMHGNSAPITSRNTIQTTTTTNPQPANSTRCAALRMGILFVAAPPRYQEPMSVN